MSGNEGAEVEGHWEASLYSLGRAKEGLLRRGRRVAGMSQAQRGASVGNKER